MSSTAAPSSASASIWQPQEPNLQALIEVLRNSTNPDSEVQRAMKEVSAVWRVNSCSQMGGLQPFIRILTFSLHKSQRERDRESSLFAVMGRGAALRRNNVSKQSSD